MTELWNTLSPDPASKSMPADGSLAERLAQGPLPLKFALRYAAEVAGTLRQLHDEGRFHGDVDRAPYASPMRAPYCSHPMGTRTWRRPLRHIRFRSVALPDANRREAQRRTCAPRRWIATLTASGSPRPAWRRAAWARCRIPRPVPGRSPPRCGCSGMLARHGGVEEELPPAHDPPAAASAAPESMRTRHHPSGHIHDLRCPSCGIHLTSSSRPRSAFEALLARLRFPILRCSRCFHRYVIFLGRPIRRPAHL